jgi:tetratricopeptide (TPR) repeat protein
MPNERSLAPASCEARCLCWLPGRAPRFSLECGLTQDPRVLDELLKTGVGQHQAGRLSEAKQAYEQVLAIDPSHPDALHLLGVIALQSADAPRAVELIQRAIQRQPRNWQYLLNLGHAHAAMHHLAEAHSAFQAASRLNRDNPQPALGAANCLAQQGQFAAAEEALRKVTRRFPALASGWYNLANAVNDQGRHDEAVMLYRRALDRDPKFAEAYNNLGRALHAQHRFDEAAQAYRRSVELKPDYAIGYCNLASVLIDSGQPVEAEAVSREALARQPALPEAERVLYVALVHQGRLTEALALERRLLARRPADPVALYSFGVNLCLLGEQKEGMSFIERAIEIDPDLSDARFARSVARLAAGDIDAAWDDYAWRPARMRFHLRYPGVTLADAMPVALDGKHVCLLREQGIGDEIFFLRFAPQLKARGARVIYAAASKVASFLGRSAALDHVVAESASLPEADFTLLVGDLPRALAASRAEESVRNVSDREAAGGYSATPAALALAPLPERVEEIRQQLTKFGPAPYIGLTWRGGTAPKMQRDTAWLMHKWVPIPGLAAAVKPIAGTLILAQRAPEGPEYDELQQHLGRTVHDLSALNEDLEGMLALLTLLDDYVGVSNANMHLRASLGKAARVLVPCPPEWRWMIAGDESPWFPGFRIYRQRPDGDWNEALGKLERDLRERFGAR